MKTLFYKPDGIQPTPLRKYRPCKPSPPDNELLQNLSFAQIALLTIVSYMKHLAIKKIATKEFSSVAIYYVMAV